MHSSDIQSYWQVKALIILLKLSLLVGAVLSFLQGSLEAGFITLLIFFITFLPILLGNRFQVKIPSEFELLSVIFVYASLFLGEVHGYYLKFWWWDLVLHASAGFLAGILGFLMVYVLNEKEEIAMDMKPGFVAFFAFVFAIAIGTTWEILEFCMDQLFGMDMQRSRSTGVVDTMWDMMVNFTGALIISILGYYYTRTESTDSFLEKWIHKFIERNPRLFERRKTLR
jgi:uncharacterized membrane protein YjdF